MKTSIAKCFLAIGLLLVATARPTSANLIVNGDFETGTFAGWTYRSVIGESHKRLA